MKGYTDFVVAPSEGRYDNKLNIDGVELILNTELQNHSYVSRVGLVIDYCAAYSPRLTAKVGNSFSVSVGHNDIINAVFASLTGFLSIGCKHVVTIAGANKIDHTALRNGGLVA